MGLCVFFTQVLYRGFSPRGKHSYVQASRGSTGTPGLPGVIRTEAIPVSNGPQPKTILSGMTGKKGKMFTNRRSFLQVSGFFSHGVCSDDESAA